MAMMPPRERRYFNDSERVSLFLASDGCCSRCGRELEPGWHADHVQPHAAGGITELDNGQALCPTCNLKKGAQPVQNLRQWQVAALRRFETRRSPDFLVVATPGAGKTTFALTAAARMIEAGYITRIIVVVPTSHLRGQWAKAGARLGIQLDSRFTNGVGVIAKDYDGVVVTYAAVASQGDLWRRHAVGESTLVILDEIHHCGERDHLSWGPALTAAFEAAHRRLLLSGTPFRSDGAPIPFVTYDPDGRCVPGYSYDYGEALRDRDVVRPIEFPVLDGTMRWRVDKVELSTELSTADDDTMAAALAVAVDPDGDWMPSVLRRADEELTRVRETMPDAGGLVIAADQSKARRYGQLLERICREPVAVAITDEPDASDIITRFTDGTSRWIVAVQMVSEGVDIPRLAVGVYASRYRTELFFQQVVGRFVRMRSPADETYASLFIPAIEPLVRFAREIETTTGAVLREQSDSKGGGSDEGPTVRVFDLIEATEAAHTSTVLGGSQPDDSELRRAQSAMNAVGITAGISVAQAALLLRAGGIAPVVGTVQVATPASPRPLVDEKMSLRRMVVKKVNDLARAKGHEQKKLHYTLNQHCGDTLPTATLETLKRRLAVLDGWLSE
jgi:superfamily II DNA or RNA helicase